MKRRYFYLLLKTFFNIGQFETLLISKFLRLLHTLYFYLKQVTIKLSKLITLKRVIISLAVIVLVFGIKSGYSFYKNIPDPKNLDNLSSEIVIYDRNQTLLFSQYGNSNYVPIQPKDLPDFLLKTVSVLDLPWEISNVLFFKEDKSLAASIKRTVISYKISKNYNGQQIINIYFNSLPFSNEAVGIEAASLQLFGKETKDLNNHQLVYLLLLPTIGPLDSRIKQTLDKLILARIITRSEKDNILREDLDFKQNLVYKRAPHAVEYILSTLNKNYPNELLSEGVIVRSTIDIRLQNIIQQLLLEKGIQGAIIVVERNKMEVLAMVGSLNYYSLDKAENSPFGESFIEKYLSASGAKTIELISQIQTSKGITFYEKLYPQMYPQIGSSKDLSVKLSNGFSIGVWVEGDKNQASLIVNDVINKALPKYEIYFRT